MAKQNSNSNALCALCGGAYYKAPERIANIHCSFKCKFKSKYVYTTIPDFLKIDIFSTDEIDLLKRFLSKSNLNYVKTYNDTPCIESTIGIAENGYSRVHLTSKKHYPLHKFSFELFNNKKLDNGILCCHHCDNRCCWNPLHLFEGTQKDNIQDMLKKGRRIRNKKLICDWGHELVEENLIGNIRKRCKECSRIAREKCYWKNNKIRLRRKKSS